MTLQVGLRYNFNTLNNDSFCNQRVQFAMKPQWKRDVVIRAAVGATINLPFYRELRRCRRNRKRSCKKRKELAGGGGNRL